MDKELYLLHGMTRTKILRPPRHLLATFGTTTFNYVMLSEIPEIEKQCRLRQGRITAQRPMLLTPDLWKKRFEGFGEETDVYKGVMEQLFGDAIRGLEYTFRNELEKTSLETATLPEIADRALSTLNRDNPPRTALLQGPDATWGLSVMKFIVDMTLRSFPTNLRELDEHDFFDPDKRLNNRTRARMEALFREAAMQPSLINKLGETLKETGLFSEFEDRFFALVKANPQV